MNSESTTYSGLVSLSVPAEEICKQAAELKTARAKQVKVAKPKIQVRTGNQGVNYIRTAGPQLGM